MESSAQQPVCQPTFPVVGVASYRLSPWPGLLTVPAASKPLGYLGPACLVRGARLGRNWTPLAMEPTNAPNAGPTKPTTRYKSSCYPGPRGGRLLPGAPLGYRPARYHQPHCWCWPCLRAMGSTTLSAASAGTGPNGGPVNPWFPVSPYADALSRLLPSAAPAPTCPPSQGLPNP